jgi:hypothetical protein
MPYEPNVCVECGCDMRPPPPINVEPLAWSGSKALDAGAEKIRERVEEMKRKR